MIDRIEEAQRKASRAAKEARRLEELSNRLVGLDLAAWVEEALADPESTLRTGDHWAPRLHRSQTRHELHFEVVLPVHRSPVANAMEALGKTEQRTAAGIPVSVCSTGIRLRVDVERLVLLPPAVQGMLAAGLVGPCTELQTTIECAQRALTLLRALNGP